MAEDAGQAPQTQASCSLVGTVVGLVAGFGLIMLGAALEEPSELIGPGSSLSALGGLMVLGALFMGWLAGVRRMLFTERGALARESAVAAGVSFLPCLVLFLFAEDLRLPERVAVVPGRLIDRELATFGTITLVCWLAVFAWRVRGPAPGDAG